MESFEKYCEASKSKGINLSTSQLRIKYLALLQDAENSENEKKQSKKEKK